MQQAYREVKEWQVYWIDSKKIESTREGLVETRKSSRLEGEKDREANEPCGGQNPMPRNWKATWT
jgi:hypothetical protein